MVGMSYDVGTHINFKKKDFRPHKEKPTLYSVGTKILFVSFIPNLQTFTIAAA